MKKLFFIFVSLVLVFTLVGCKANSTDDVINKLSKKMSKLDSYIVDATMTVTKNNNEDVYNVKIMHKKPDNYKVTLEQVGNSYKQIIVKNPEGVFVLTPKFNKTVKFSSDWPLNSSNAYMVESLISDMISDKSMKFSEEGDFYKLEGNISAKFDPAMDNQKILIDKKTMLPKHVIVFNKNMEQILKVDFNDMKLNPKVDDTEFDVEYTMTLNEEEPDLDEEKETFSYPTYLPEGATFEDESRSSERLVMTFSGSVNYTIIQDYSFIRPVFSEEEEIGSPVFILGVYGSISDEKITFTKNGVDYTISSKELSKEELYKVAESLMNSTDEK